MRIVTKKTLSVLFLFLFIVGFFTLTFSSLLTYKASAKPQGGHDETNGLGYTISGEWVDRHAIKITDFRIGDCGILNDVDGVKQWCESNNGKGIDEVNANIKKSIQGDNFNSGNIAPDSKETTLFRKKALCNDKENIAEIYDDLDAPGNPTTNKFFINSNNFWIPDNKGVCRTLIGDQWGPGPHIPGTSTSRNLVFDLSHEENRTIWFRQHSGSNSFDRVDGQASGFNKIGDDPNGKIFTQGDVRGNAVSLEFKDPPKKGIQDATYHTQEGNNPDIAVKAIIDDAEAVKKPGGTTPDSTGSGAGGPKTDCEVKLLNPLTWLMCPIITAATLAVNTLDNAITSQLTVQTGQGSIYDENTDNGKALFNTWASFRYIALGLLVIVGLIMIISQALNFGIFDAYTIKKIMPKILIGIIGISVSWYLCKFAIDFFNDLGVGVRSLLYGPFKSLGTVRFDQGATSLLGIGTGVAIVGLGLIGILSFVATALLAVIIAFGILVFRQIIIILLVVTAPLAIVCWILPNTERVWKMWWDFFIRALVVFPIIALFIAGGRVIAAIATQNANQSGQSNFLASCIAFIAYFGPYFALPAAFRLAGGAIAQVGGIANDRSRGVFDRLKKGRQERFADRMQRAKNEKLYNPATIDAFKNSRFGKTKVGRQIGKVNPNKLATWTAAPGKNLQYAAKDWKIPGTQSGIPGLSAAGRRLHSDIESSVMDQSEKWLQHVNKHGANDKFYRAVGGMYDGFSAATKERLIQNGFAENYTDSNGVEQIRATRSLKTEKDFTDMAKIMHLSDSDSERKAGEALHANAAFTAGMYADADMNYASTAVGSAMGLAAHGFFNPNDAADAGNLLKKEGADTAFAHAAVVQAEAIGASKNPDVKPGYGHVIDHDGNFVSGVADRERAYAALETFGADDYAQAKSGFYKDTRMGGYMKELLNASGARGGIQGGIDRKNQLLAWRAELQGKGMGDTEIQDTINKRLKIANGVKNQLQQTAGSYSRGSADSIGIVQDLLSSYNVGFMGGEVDPSAARGGAVGNGGPSPVSNPSAGGAAGPQDPNPLNRN